MTTETEVNPLRAEMVANVVRLHQREPLTVEALALYFPPDFDLGADDLAPFAPIEVPPPSAIGDYVKASKEAAPDVEFDADPPAPHVPGQDIGEVRVVSAKANVDPASVSNTEPEAPPPPTQEEINAAVERKIAAERDLPNKRVALIAAGSAEREARAKLAAAVTQFQSGLAPITPQELRSQFVKEQQAIRSAIARGEMPGRPGPKIGKSAVDRNAFYSRSTNPAHGDYRRGSYPASARGRTVAPKVASER